MLRQTAQGGFVTAAPSLQEICDFRSACVDGYAVSPWASKNIQETWPVLGGHFRLYRRKENKVSP